MKNTSKNHNDQSRNFPGYMHVQLFCTHILSFMILDVSLRINRFFSLLLELSLLTVHYWGTVTLAGTLESPHHCSNIRGLWLLNALLHPRWTKWYRASAWKTHGKESWVQKFSITWNKVIVMWVLLVTWLAEESSASEWWSAYSLAPGIVWTSQPSQGIRAVTVVPLISRI